MATQKVLVHTDHNGNEIRNFSYEKLTSDPIGPTESRTYYNTTTKQWRGWDGSSWINLSFNLTGALIFKGALDCSTNPNYPVSEVGNQYVVSIAGKIGGILGPDVEVGDYIICIQNSAGGTQSIVGGQFTILQRNLETATDVVDGVVRLANDIDLESENVIANAVVTSNNFYHFLRDKGLKKVVIPTFDIFPNTPVLIEHLLNTAFIEIKAIDGLNQKHRLEYTVVDNNSINVESKTAIAGLKVIISTGDII